MPSLEYFWTKPAVAVDVAIMEPVAEQVAVAPRPNDAAFWVELDHGRSRPRPVEIDQIDVSSVENKDVISIVNAHASETTGDPLIA